MVQGVVVQMSTETGRPARAGAFSASAAADGPRIGNSTKIDGDRWSSYSTSASARAVRQCRHQWTGFLPLYTTPCSTKRPRARTIAAW